MWRQAKNLEFFAHGFNEEIGKFAWPLPCTVHLGAADMCLASVACRIMSRVSSPPLQARIESSQDQLTTFVIYKRTGTHGVGSRISVSTKGHIDVFTQHLPTLVCPGQDYGKQSSGAPFTNHCSFMQVYQVLWL